MSLYGALAEAVREGKELVCGEKALDGSNPTPITTPFASIRAVVLTREASAAPGLNTSVLTYEVDGSTVNVYAWKPTSATDPTLIASTGTENFSYTIIGKRR